MPTPAKNEIGNIYGYLTVISRAENNKEGRAQWLCRCKCGNELIVLGKHLRSGNTKSCGCYQKERAIASNQLRGGDLTGSIKRRWLCYSSKWETKQIMVMPMRLWKPMSCSTSIFKFWRYIFMRMY